MGKGGVGCLWSNYECFPISGCKDTEVLFGEVSSSSGCLGWATLFNCGTP